MHFAGTLMVSFIVSQIAQITLIYFRRGEIVYGDLASPYALV